MNDQAQRIALPTALRRKLQAFRVGKGNEYKYLVTNVESNKSYRFEPWQFFILESLPVCEDFMTLASVFEDRFGHSITVEEVNELFKLVSDNKLFGLSVVSHPLLIKFNKNQIARNLQTDKNELVQDNNDAEQQVRIADAEIVTEIAALPAGVQDAIGFDERTKKGFKLFNPKTFIKIIFPILRPFKFFIYVIPTFFILALFVVYTNFDIFVQNVTQLFQNFKFIDHVIFGMMTVNISATLITALVAYSYRASPVSFGIVFHFGFFPRFMVQLSNVNQLSRKETMWLHAAPLFLRLGLSSVGVLIWFLIQTTAENSWSFWLAISTISTISLLLTINPLVKSNGYHLLSAYLDEPYLKGKSYKALINKFKGNVYQDSNQNILSAYALVSFLFVIFVIVVILYTTGHILKTKLGGAGFLLTLILAFFLIKRLIVKLKIINDAYNRSTQFERWKKRTLPSEVTENIQDKQKFSIASFVKVASIILILTLLFIPYHFKPGGKFIILPHQKQEIAADISGIIDNVYYDGGEILKKGTKIAQLDCSEYSSQEKIFSARIQEQKAIIDELKSKPLPEEVLLARSALEVQKTRVQFSEAKVSRLDKLYKDRATSFEELDDARREYRVDIDQRQEKEANLKLVQLGTSPDEIAAAEAKLKSLEEQRSYYQHIIEKSVLYMPFHGRLVDLHLQQKVGSFLEKGKPLAIVENTEQVIAQIEVAEPDIGYIDKSAKTIVRPMAIQDEEFHGVVSLIAPNVLQKGFGKVVQVTTVLENKNEMLKSGMTGYAKIECDAMPAWKVFSLGILRFIKVEMWSWIP